MCSNDEYCRYVEERLYLLRKLEDLCVEQKKQAEANASQIAAAAQKGERDIKAAHDKIRVMEGEQKKLEQTGTSLKIKNWVLGGLLVAAGAIAMAILQGFLQHR